MKTLTAAFTSHLQQETTTLATCWKLTRKDGVIFGFTDHDRDIIYSSVTYIASTGMQGSAVAQSGKPEVDVSEIDGVLDSDLITADDIARGKYDGAKIELFLLNYEDLTMDRVLLKVGFLGDIQWNDTGFSGEFKGLADMLHNAPMQAYSPSCRADLGDTRCRYAIADDRESGTITSVDSDEPGRIFFDSALSLTADNFEFGYVQWLTGDNSGLSMDIEANTLTQVTLALKMPDDISVGDTFFLLPGCDKQFATCRDRFSNANNFQGEPYLPGPLRVQQEGATE